MSHAETHPFEHRDNAFPGKDSRGVAQEFSGLADVGYEYVLIAVPPRILDISERLRERKNLLQQRKDFSASGYSTRRNVSMTLRHPRNELSVAG